MSYPCVTGEDTEAEEVKQWHEDSHLASSGNGLQRHLLQDHVPELGKQV